MEAFAALMLMGVRVREVRDLEEETIWLPRQRLLIIDATLSPSRREEAACLYLPDALALVD